MTIENPSYLQTSPIGEDLFAGKSHEAISKKIAQQIKCGNHCQMIGIDGGWGAGKSNLVKLISKELNEGVCDKKKQKYPFVTYDAWGHSSDLQRRTILEEITKALINEYDCLDKSWELKLNELLARKKSTHSKRIPRLNIALVVASLLISITPLITWLVSLIPNDYPWAKLLIATVPYLVGFSYVIINKSKSDKKYGVKHSDFSSYIEELFLIYKDKISEDSTYEIVSEKEPSSSQFKEWMHGLDNSLKNNKKVVLVFDNMDRLPIAKVQEFWAAIHSFFAEEEFKNIIIIVPFDRSHIINAFKTEDDEKEKKCYGNDFINKTFTVVHRVAPPIMSDWKAFFYQKWKEAFGSESNPEKEVTQIYDANTPEITPRNIIAFINELITLKLSTNEAIPDKYHALYIFGKDKISAKPIDELLSPTYLGNLSFLYNNDTEMAKYMSAIHYQLPLEKAMDVVFTRQFKSALDNKDNAIINQLAKNNSTFKNIAEVAILDVNNIENATIALETSDLSNIEKEIVDYVWECLYRRTLILNLDFSVYKPFHSILLSHINNRYTYISMLIEQYQNVKEKDFNCKAYIQGVNAIRDIDKQTLNYVFEKVWEISPSLFMKLTQITKDSYDDYGYYCSEDNIDEYLSSLDISEWGILSINKSMTQNYQLNKYKNNLTEKIKLSGANVTDIQICIERLKEVQSYIKNAESLIEDNTLYNILNSINNESPIYADLICIAIAKRGSYRYKNYDPYSKAINSPSEHDIESVSNVIEFYVTYGDLFANYSAYDNFLIKEVFKCLTDKWNGKSKVSIKDCLKNYPAAKSHYLISAESLLVKLDGWASYYKGEDIYSPELIADCLKINNNLTKSILKSLNEYLQNKSQEDWCNDLKSSHILGDYYYRYHPNINQNMYDAIKELVNDCVANNKTISNKDIIDKLLSICNNLDCNVKEFFIDTLNKFNSVHPTKEKIMELAPWIFKYIGKDLEAHRENLFKFLATEVISNNTIIHLLYENRQLLVFKKPEDFKRKIRQLAEATNDDKSEIRQLAKFWKLIKDKKE